MNKVLLIASLTVVMLYTACAKEDVINPPQQQIEVIEEETPTPEIVTIDLNYNDSDYEGFVVADYKGFSIHVDENDLDIGDDAILLMTTKIDRLYEILPMHLLEKFKVYKIFMDDRSNDYPDKAAWANPNNDGWQIENGFLSGLGYSTYIINFENWVNWSQVQPDILLHEMAHLYHGDVLGFDHADILEGYDNALETYGKVRRLGWDGTISGQHDHYGLTNHREYFAELTEAYFGFNDFFPNTNEELKDYDPVGYELINNIIQ